MDRKDIKVGMIKQSYALAKTSKTRYLYTVYVNGTEKPLIVDGTASECAKVMGLTNESCFRYCASQSKKPTAKSFIERKWRIEKKRIT